jgi:hypothetical protein
MASGGHRRVRTRVICSSALTRCAGSKSCHTRAWSRSSRRGAVAELRGDVLRRLALVDEQRGEARAQVSRSDSPGAVLVAGGRPRGAPRRPESALAPVVPVVIGPRLAANDSGSPGASEGRGGSSCGTGFSAAVTAACAPSLCPGLFPWCSPMICLALSTLIEPSKFASPLGDSNPRPLPYHRSSHTQKSGDYQGICLGQPWRKCPQIAGVRQGRVPLVFHGI